MRKCCHPIGGECVQCGRRVASLRTCPAGPNAHLLKPKEKPTPCELLGEPAGVALFKCKGCCGNVRLKVEYNACPVFGKCLPEHSGTVTADDGQQYHGCGGCEKKSTPAATPTT